LSQVYAFDVCAATQTVLPILFKNKPGCSGCTKFLLCQGFKNAVTQCTALNATDAIATANLIAAGGGAGGYSQFLSTYLGVSYDATAVSNGLTGTYNCKTNYGSSSTCDVSQKKPNNQATCILPANPLN